MISHSHTAIRTDYPFLAYPPQKNRPIQPRPTPPSNQPLRGLRRTSSWADNGVQPAAYISPNRHDPLGRSRHHDLATPSMRIPTAPSLHTSPISPTPATAFGYPSAAAVQFPKPPVSASLPFPVEPQCPDVAARNITGPLASGPSPTFQPRGLTRLRSLSLRKRSRSKSVSVCPNPSPRTRPRAPAESPSMVQRRKPKHGPLPLPFSHEVALMQLDSGSIDNCIKRAMEVRAQQAGDVCLPDVYRDSHGGIWLDQEERWEYAALLTDGESSPPATGNSGWVTFDGNQPPLPAKESRHRHKPNFSVDAAFSLPGTSSNSTEFYAGRKRRSPVDVEQARKEFLEASFMPVIPSPGPMGPTRSVSMSTPADSARPRKKSMLNIMGIFRHQRKT